jgi:predicted acylesterase/phospholipase RssA
VLCLSGGGSYGAYSAGVLCGWTASGDRPGCGGRPNFDVVTGISTGALIAPLAFLGPQYDDEIRKFYTTVEKKDIYRLRPVRGLFTTALADNAPLAELVDGVLTPEVIRQVAEEHRKGRRLYIGTTELESKRFVFWDLGEIANRGCPGDRELIKKILLGSSAIPGFFPPAEIPVTVDGRVFVEKHGDGGTSASIFFRPPYVPPGQRTPEALDLAGVDLYMIVAGKLFADSTPLKNRSLTIATSSVSSVIYSQTRGDLQRVYLISLLNGMNYHLAAIPADFPAPSSSTAFERGPMTAMFDEGYRLAATGQAWRRSPPGVEPGESPLQRNGTDLTYIRRGPGLVLIDDKPVSPPILAPGPLPIPVPPTCATKQ